MAWPRKPIQEQQRQPHGRASLGDSRSAVDEFVDSWVCWREACEDLRRAYASWGTATAPRRALAFGSYRAALEREEQAALVHAVSTRRLHARER